MRRKRFLAVAAILVSFSVPAGARSYKQAGVAKQEYDAVFSHADTPCTWTDNRSYIECMSKEITFTEGHLEAFVSALRGIAAEVDGTNQPNPGSPRVLDQLNKTDTAWHAYRENACRLQFAWFGRGTGGPPAAAECELAQDREYMKLLAGFFNLHQLA